MEKVNDLVKTEGLDDLSDKGVIYRDPCPLLDSDSIVKAVLVGAAVAMGTLLVVGFFDNN